MASGGAAYRPHQDWQNRTGRVASYSRDRSHAYVVWNGNRSCDRVSVDLIEPYSFAPDVADALVGPRPKPFYELLGAIHRQRRPTLGEKHEV